MAVVKLFQPVPSRDPVVGTDRLSSLIWLRWFNFVADIIGRRSEASFVYDPPSIASGATSSVSVSFQGALPGDFAQAAFSQVVTGITINATATTNSVTVSFTNLTAGAIDMPQGTLRVRVEAQN